MSLIRIIESGVELGRHFLPGQSTDDDGINYHQQFMSSTNSSNCGFHATARHATLIAAGDWDGQTADNGIYDPLRMLAGSARYNRLEIFMHLHPHNKRESYTMHDKAEAVRVNTWFSLKPICANYGRFLRRWYGVYANTLVNKEYQVWVD